MRSIASWTSGIDSVARLARLEADDRGQLEVALADAGADGAQQRAALAARRRAARPAAAARAARRPRRRSPAAPRARGSRRRRRAHGSARSKSSPRGDRAPADEVGERLAAVARRAPRSSRASNSASVSRAARIRQPGVMQSVRLAGASSARHASASHRHRSIDSQPPSGRPHRLPPRRPAHRPHVDPAGGRHAAGGAHLAARGRRGGPGAGDPRVPALPQGRRVRRARLAPPPVLRRPRVRRRAGRPARHAATPTGSSRTSTCRRSRTTRSRSSPGSPRSRGARGAVGMIGISWGGFNGLQVAARRPPALKAVISMCASDDRYADDVHYVGGCVLGRRHAPVGGDDAHAATRCRPTRPSVGDGWRDTWLRAHGAHAAVRRGVARPPAPRRLLAPGLGVRGLRGDRGAGLRGRRLGRRLHQRDPAPARGPARAAQGADRPVVARLPAGRRARARRSASCRSACAGSTSA